MRAFKKKEKKINMSQLHQNIVHMTLSNIKMIVPNVPVYLLILMSFHHIKFRKTHFVLWNVRIRGHSPCSGIHFG